ncbi:MAG TPA: hypothetical protein VLC72_06265 [Nitrosopumilaceae archaeon]|nr:hypothetical protein [Nitrosopumilaceae archaeon]
MKEPHNHAKVGYSMIVVAASLTAIGLIALAIGSDVLFADKIQRGETAHFKECKVNGFVDESCQQYMVFVKAEECIANQDLESRDCYLFKTYVESAIFEECRANKDISSPQCQKYIGKFAIESES